MANVIKQGDSYPVFMNLSVNGTVLNPDMVGDLEIYIGEDLRYTYTAGTVKYDIANGRWYVWPAQEDTFSLEPGVHKVEARVKFKNINTDNVKGYTLNDKIKVIESMSREVL